jgi:hypothetical protein
MSISLDGAGPTGMTPKSSHGAADPLQDIWLLQGHNALS